LATEERISTGVPELDNVIGEGIPIHNLVLLAGIPGAGKTLLAFQYLYKNAKVGRKGLFISLDEGKEQIIRNAKLAFPDLTDIDSVISSGGMDIFDIDALNSFIPNDFFDKSQAKQGWSLTTAKRNRVINSLFMDFEKNFVKLIKDRQAKLVVIDNITIVRDMVASEFEYRNFIADLGTLLKVYTLGAFVVKEIAESRREDIVFEPDFFGFDGIILLYSIFRSGKRTSALEILKMRGTEHSFSSLPYIISSQGIKVLRVEDTTAFQMIWK
jgi:KaiC/GvpD/RAD55 family RecA-like ATPase